MLLLFSFQSGAQLRNWHMSERFTGSGKYDFDLGRIIGQPMDCNVTILVDIDEDGTGRLITYIGDHKTIFSITSATSFNMDLDNPSTHLKCANREGGAFRAGIQMAKNKNGTYYVSQIWLTQQDRTAMLFFN